MPIKKEGCRITERSQMFQYQAQGMTVAQISNVLSVKEDMINRVLGGEFEAEEKKASLHQKQVNEQRKVAKDNKELIQAQNMGKAIAEALNDSGKNEAKKAAPARKRAKAKADVKQATETQTQTDEEET